MVVHNLETGDERHFGVPENIYTMSLWTPPSHEVHFHRQPLHTTRNIVNLAGHIACNSVESGQEVEMLETEEKSPTGWDAGMSFFWLKPVTSPKESEKRLLCSDPCAVQIVVSSLCPSWSGSLDAQI